MQKVHIEKNTVQETLIIPLYARKLATQHYPELFRDEKAVALIERLDYDFSALEEKSGGLMQRFGALEVAMRQNDLAAEAKDYLCAHPSAAVVNLGCGLDQTGENVDNGTCLIYNIDLPDVIAVRNELLPAGPRVKNIAVNINDTAWFGEIDASGGVVFLAAGVFYYFTAEQIKVLFTKMCERFGGGRLIFDIAGKSAVKMMIKTWVKQAKIQNVDAYFYVADVNADIKPWLNAAAVSSKGYMLGYNDLKTPAVSGFFRLLAKAGDGLMQMKIVRIDF